MNKYFFTLLCVTVLAVAPACKRKSRKLATQRTVKTIELESAVSEKGKRDSNNNLKSINKF